MAKPFSVEKGGSGGPRLSKPLPGGVEPAPFESYEDETFQEQGEVGTAPLPPTPLKPARKPYNLK